MTRTSINPPRSVAWARNILPAATQMRILVLCLLATLIPWLAEAQIDWRVSVKLILDAEGRRPSAGNFNTDLEISNTIQLANSFLARTGRGYQFRLLEITDVPGVSQWFNTDRVDSPALEAAAEADKTLYRYRDNAINVYINGWEGTGRCSFPNDPSGNNDIIFMGQESFLTTFAHEAGHYFNLNHTFYGERFLNVDFTDCEDACACAVLIGGDGDASQDDSIKDHECWDTRDQIAQGNYGVNYGSPGSNDAAVDRVFLNLMSYRVNVRFFLTADQMDLQTGISNGVRFKVASGRTVFVASYGDDVNGNGSSGSRYRTLAKGLSVASQTDIILLHGSNYTAPAPTLTQPVTLAATRGAVTLRPP